MAFKSEFQVWQDELAPPPRLTIAERVAAWFDRPAKDPAPDAEMFCWRDPAALFPNHGDDR